MLARGFVIKYHLFYLEILFIFIMESSAIAYLTSDVTGSLGIASNTVKLTGTTQNITSTGTFDFSYNAYYQPLHSAFIMNFTEYAKTSVGSLNQVRIGFGIRWYIFGFNGERYIVDSQTEGRVFRPAPFWSLTGGMSTISVPKVNQDSGQYFNAVGMDWDLRTGIEVPINRNYYLVSQLSVVVGVPTYNSTTRESLQYQAMALYVGLKLTSF